MTYELVHGDCMGQMSKMSDNTVDLVVTDPPYRVISGGSKSRRNRPNGILKKNDGKIFAHNSIKASEWFPELYRVLKEQSHCYVMTNVLNLPEYLELAIQSGFKLHNLLVWHKNNCTPSQWYMKNAEYVLFLRKGRAKYVRNMGSKTVHTFDSVQDRRHPTEKPVQLMELYVGNSSMPGDLVLDPFMGSGTTGVACKILGRRFMGIEVDPEHFQVALTRLGGTL